MFSTSKLMAVISLPIFMAATLHAQRTWTGAVDSTWGTAGNWTPSTAPSGATGYAIFNTASQNVNVGAAAWLNSVTLKTGSSGFAMSGTNLILGAGGGGGLIVETGVNASFANTLVAQDANSDLLINIANNSSVAFSGQVSSQGKKLVKTGAGTMVLSAANNGAWGTGTWDLNEGTVRLQNGGIVSAAGPSTLLNINLGTGSTAARLAGIGSVNAKVLLTSGSATSTIAPEGTLSLRQLDTAGAKVKFEYNLGTSLLSGAGFATSSLTLSGPVEFNFSGGDAGVVYTLFSGYNSINITDPAWWGTNGWKYNDSYALDTSFGLGGWSLSGGTLQVRFSTIPEPGTGLLAVLGVSAALLFRRFRRLV